jgi:hypothetical protein
LAIVAHARCLPCLVLDEGRCGRRLRAVRRRVVLDVVVRTTRLVRRPAIHDHGADEDANVDPGFRADLLPSGRRFALVLPRIAQPRSRSSYLPRSWAFPTRSLPTAPAAKQEINAQPLPRNRI